MPPAALFRARGPAAKRWARVLYFLAGKKWRKEPGKGGSPFAILPRQWETVQDRALDWQLACGRLATGSMYARPPLRGGSPRTESLAAAFGVQAVSFPRSGGASQGATVGTPCRSCPKRGGNCPTAAHEVKRRLQTFCRAPDGVVSLATRAGFQRARPFGHSCLLLVKQKYSP